MIVTQIAESDPAGGPPGLFTTIATNKYYMIQYFSVDLTQPAPRQDGQDHRQHARRSTVLRTAQPPHTEHPTLQLDRTTRA